MTQTFGFQDDLTLPPPSAKEEIGEPAMREARAGDALARAGMLEQAKPHYKKAVELDPNSSSLYWLLGVCHCKLGEMDEGRQALEESIRLNPSSVRALASVSQIYLVQGKLDLALKSSGRALKIAPLDNESVLMRAWALESAGELDEAWDLIQRLVACGFHPQFVAPLYARMARYRGEQLRAMAFLSAALAIKNLTPRQQADLHFAAAELLDGLGDYETAFAHAVRGNLLRGGKHDPEDTHVLFDRMISFFTPERLQQLLRATDRSDKPVFIVGMPRSGTSLVEQILASHPDIHGAGELDLVFKSTLQMTEMLGVGLEQIPQCIANVNREQIDNIASGYLAAISAPKPSAKRVTDKMPLNFVHLGMINVLFPGARIIHCRRDPMDTCVSCYMTAFSFGNDFKQDLTHLGKFYHEYQRLMDHWKTVIDLPMLDVEYEKLLADPEAQIRAILDFVNVPFDNRCMHFHETKRPVVTSSVQQVRRPIYKTSLQRWKRYEKHLGPLRSALQS